MKQPQFKTKRQFIHEIGLSKSTFYRLLKKNNIATASESFSPNTENELRIRLVFPPLAPEQINAMKEYLERLKQMDIEAIED